MLWIRVCCFLAWNVLLQRAAGATCQQNADSTALLQLKPGDSVSNDIGYFVWMTDLHGDPYYATDIRQCRKQSLYALKDQTFGLMGLRPPNRFGLVCSIRCTSNGAAQGVSPLHR